MKFVNFNEKLRLFFLNMYKVYDKVCSLSYSKYIKEESINETE